MSFIEVMRDPGRDLLGLAVQDVPISVAHFSGDRVGHVQQLPEVRIEPGLCGLVNKRRGERLPIPPVHLTGGRKPGQREKNVRSVSTGYESDAFRQDQDGWGYPGAASASARSNSEHKSATSGRRVASLKSNRMPAARKSSGRGREPPSASAAR